MADPTRVAPVRADAADRFPLPAAAPRPGGQPEDPTHALLLHAVGELEALVERLETGDTDAWCRERAALVIDTLGRTARQHHAHEERVVFPALLRLDDPALHTAIARLRDDHGWLEENWLTLLAELQPVAEGYGGWDPALLRHATAVFSALMREHIELEERLVVRRWMTLAAEAAAQADADTGARPVAALLRASPLRSAGPSSS